MSELNRALMDLRSIRRHVAETTEFRGYGPATLFGTAVAAVLAGAAQMRWVADPERHAGLYVGLWLTTALVSAALIVAQMLRRATRLHSGMADAMIRTAVSQFLPAAVAGVILPLVLLRGPGTALWMLPGLWQVIFSLGVFASCRSLPRAMLLVGVWFLLTGFSCLALGDSRALAPGWMVAAYGIGMVGVAAIHANSARKVVSDEAD